VNVVRPNRASRVRSIHGIIETFSTPEAEATGVDPTMSKSGQLLRAIETRPSTYSEDERWNDSEDEYGDGGDDDRFSLGLDEVEQYEETARGFELIAAMLSNPSGRNETQETRTPESNVERSPPQLKVTAATPTSRQGTPQPSPRGMALPASPMPSSRSVPASPMYVSQPLKSSASFQAPPPPLAYSMSRKRSAVGAGGSRWI